MSADNWGLCPQCRNRQGAEIRAREAEAMEAYGKVPVAEWKKLDDAARLIPAPEYTLREDYEIGIYEDRFAIDYAASCSKCGFSHSFKHDKSVPTTPPVKTGGGLDG